MRLTSKGQITIPKKLRDRFGLGPDVEVEVVEEGNTLRVIKRRSGSHAIDRVYGILKKKQRTDPLIERIRGR
ncbi:MAG: AbrB/MazE/SpoVT family DNA-binding domain-containing protein [Deltaproteobacteria bacterium]|nr:AbrB/MazE/SpoVT family DNA-binding domain-containing protein [Deltaproteobacteria bacterium]